VTMVTRRGQDVPLVLASGANAALEHEVELLRFSNFIARIWVEDLVFLAKLTKVGSRIIVKLGTRSAFREQKRADEGEV
jgi:hypothetical protein